MKRYEITQGTVFIGSLCAESPEKAVELAENEMYDYINALALDGNPPLVATLKTYDVEYLKVGDETVYKATFDSLGCAVMFWESLFYLHSVYQIPLTHRPR